MDIYTYCSSRGSRYGFQYASFSSDSKGVISSYLARERPEHDISPAFIRWCENKSGWQLVLEKSPNKDKYLLMAGQLEKSRGLEKKNRKSRGETDFDENGLDSIFYMTLGFCGTAAEIKPIAVFLLKQYKQDGFRELFNALEKTIHQSADAARYEIDTAEFNSIFSGLPVPSRPSPTPKSSGILDNVVRRFIAQPHNRLSVERIKANKETRRTRSNNVNECIELLADMESFSENFLLLVAYNYFSVSDKINIHIDYEYFVFG